MRSNKTLLIIQQRSTGKNLIRFRQDSTNANKMFQSSQLKLVQKDVLFFVNVNMNTVHCTVKLHCVRNVAIHIKTVIFKFI